MGYSNTKEYATYRPGYPRSFALDFRHQNTIFPDASGCIQGTSQGTKPGFDRAHLAWDFDS